MSWVILAVLIAYVIAVLWAWSAGLSPWVFIIGTLGSVGIVWFAYHCTHTFHDWKWFLLCMVLGGWAALTLVTPILEWRSVLSGPEIWCYILCGGLGIAFLTYEVGHLLHHHPRWGTFVGIGALVLLIGLYVTRPAGSSLSLLPPITVRPPPTRSAGHPGFGGASGGSASGSIVAPSPVATSTGALDCASLSPRAAKAAGCKR